MLRRIERAPEAVSDRRADVRRMLVERRRELRDDIQTRVRDIRDERRVRHHVAAYPDEAGDGEATDDLAFALIQMKAEALERVNDAVRRFDEGAYGCCVDCGDANRAVTTSRDAVCDAVPRVRGNARAPAIHRASRLGSRAGCTGMAGLKWW